MRVFSVLQLCQSVQSLSSLVHVQLHAIVSWVKKYLFVAIVFNIWRASEGETADSRKALLSDSVKESTYIWLVSSSRVTSEGWVRNSST
jgi:hypothetical protein